MTDFYLTRMGRTYFEHTLPALVRQLERLNENLERLIQHQHPTETTHGEGHQEDDRDRTQEAQPPHG